MTRAMMSMRAMPSSCATSRRCEGPSSSSPSSASSSSTIGARGAARATRRPRVALARERTIARDGNAEFANDSGGYERYMRDAEEEEATTAERRGAKGGDEAANVVEDEAGRAQGENYEDEFAGLIRSRKEAAETETRKRWNEGAATPRVAFDLGQDYVRRVSVAYPYAVVGSSRGDVVVCDVISASALAVSPVAHKKSWKDADARPLGERVLLGAHDGGARHLGGHHEDGKARQARTRTREFGRARRHRSPVRGVHELGGAARDWSRATRRRRHGPHLREGLALDDGARW